MAKENSKRIVVQKYGGTSVGSAERIREVTKRIIRHRERGDSIVVRYQGLGAVTMKFV